MPAGDGHKLRVLHFAGSYAPVPGGTSVRVQNLLGSADYEHVVIVPWPTPDECPKGHPTIAATETRGHVRIHRVAWPPGARWQRHFPLYRDRRQARHFVARAAAEEAQILHGHNPLACALAALAVKRRRALPMVYEVHGIMHDLPRHQRPFGPLTPLNRMTWRLARRLTAHWERQVLRAADRIITQTAAARDRLLALYPLDDKPIHVVPNGVEPERFDPQGLADARQALRARHGWQDRIVCLYAGYLNAVNGIDFLLDATTRLSASARRRLKFVALGRGPLQARVEQHARTRGDLIEYAGLVDYEQMPAYYAACDVFVIPRPPVAPAEAFVPMKLLEAMAMEKLLLVSDVGAMVEVIQDGRNGWLFPAGNAAALQRRLTALACDGVDRALGRNARADVLQQYTWDGARRALQAVYEAVT
jgi:glycogen(starch) synthase